MENQSTNSVNTENENEKELKSEERDETNSANEDHQVEDEVDSKLNKHEKVDFKEKYFYLAAEMENMRKRFEREKDSLVKYSNEKVLSELITVVDNFERTLSALSLDQDSKVKNIVTGINMVNGQLLDVLKKFGLTQLESIGKVFDPNFHEAMGEEVAEGKKAQEIIKEYEKGYLLNGRLLRAAKVILAKSNN